MSEVKLFLDDMRRPPDSSWHVVRSYDQFVRFIEENGVPDVISFDHDLADEHYEVASEIPYGKYTEKTGYDCARWLMERGTLPREFVVHSMNPVGAWNIRFLMRLAVKHLGAKTTENLQYLQAGG